MSPAEIESEQYISIVNIELSISTTHFLMQTSNCHVYKEYDITDVPCHIVKTLPLYLTE